MVVYGPYAIGVFARSISGYRIKSVACNVKVGNMWIRKELNVLACRRSVDAQEHVRRFRLYRRWHASCRTAILLQQYEIRVNFLCSSCRLLDLDL